jgi:hypothetical protein
MTGLQSCSQTKFCPTSWKQVATGKFVIDPRLLTADSTAFKCAICKQSLLSTKNGICQISFRKSQQAGRCGFVISGKVKGSGQSQPVCIACIERWVGRALLTKTSISAAPAGWMGPAEGWFARIERTDSWRQQRVLLGEEVIRLQMMNAKNMEAAGGKRIKSAAEGALNRGRQAGQIPRKPPQPVSAFCRDLFIAGQGFARDRVSSFQAISSNVRISRVTNLARSELLWAAFL